MDKWTFPTQVYSGSDSLNRLQRINNESVLIICDPFLKNSPDLNYVLSLIESSNRIEIYTDVVPDPPIEDVAKGVIYVEKIHPTIIIAIGGGSAIDMGKGIVYFARRIKQISIKCFIAIPTTSGTGSEVTSFAVLTDSETQIKYPLMDDAVLPEEALLTPLFVKTAPHSVTAYSGMDVLVHALEAYVATLANRFTDALAFQAVMTVFQYLPICDGPDVTEGDRMAMHEASCLAGLAFNKAGLGIVHAMAHQLGGQFHVPHGLANSMLLPYVIAFNTQHDFSVLHKYAKLVRALGFAGHDASDRYCIEALIEAIIKLEAELRCPMTLTAFGIDKQISTDKLDFMAERALQDMCYQFNPYKASKFDLHQIYMNIL